MILPLLIHFVNCNISVFILSDLCYNEKNIFQEQRGIKATVSEPVPTQKELETYKLKCRLMDDLSKDKKTLVSLNSQMKSLKLTKLRQNCVIFSFETLLVILTGYFVYLLFNGYIKLDGELIMIVWFALKQLFILITVSIKIFLDMDLALSRKLSKRIGYLSIPMKSEILQAEIENTAKRTYEKQQIIDSIKVPDYLEYK